MLFAMPSVRSRLNLGTRASFDPDVKAKRLVVADAHLNKALYGSLDTMVPFYGKGSVKGVDPTKSRIKPRAAGKGAKPAAPKKAPPAAKPKSAAQLPKIPVSVSDLNAMGYVAIGSISRQKTPSHIAGKKWNSPDTFYSQGNRLTPGDKIDPHKVKEGMIVWRKSK